MNIFIFSQQSINLCTGQRSLTLKCIFCVQYICFCCHLAVTAGNVFSCLLLTAGLLDWLHSDDPVCACGVFHPRGLHPDDCMG